MNECAFHTTRDVAQTGVVTVRCAHLGDAYVHERVVADQHWIARVTPAGMVDSVDVCPSCVNDVWAEANRRMLADEPVRLYLLCSSNGGATEYNSFAIE